MNALPELKEPELGLRESDVVLIKLDDGSVFTARLQQWDDDDRPSWTLCGRDGYGVGLDQVVAWRPITNFDPTTIVIGIEGGVVQGASSSGPVHDRIVILDYDYDEDLGDAGGIEVNSTKAHVIEAGLTTLVDPDWVGLVVNAIEERAHKP